MIFKRRGRWCFEDSAGKLYKFGSEWEAKIAYGKVDGEKEDLKIEEETSTDKQEVIFESEIGSEEEV